MPSRTADEIRKTAKAWVECDRGFNMADLLMVRLGDNVAYTALMFGEEAAKILSIPIVSFAKGTVLYDPPSRAAAESEIERPWREEVKRLTDLIDEHAPMGIGYEVRKAYIEHARALMKSLDNSQIPV